jgi:hypothetical protein
MLVATICGRYSVPGTFGLGKMRLYPKRRVLEWENTCARHAAASGDLSWQRDP